MYTYNGLPVPLATRLTSCSARTVRGRRDWSCFLSSDGSPAFRAASRTKLRSWHSPARREKRELTKRVKTASIAQRNDVTFFHGNERRSRISLVKKSKSSGTSKDYDVLTLVYRFIRDLCAVYSSLGYRMMQCAFLIIRNIF